MGKKYWNQGIMTESLKAVVNYLITEIGFKRIKPPIMLIILLPGSNA